MFILKYVHKWLPQCCIPDPHSPLHLATCGLSFKFLLNHFPKGSLPPSSQTTSTVLLLIKNYGYSLLKLVNTGHHLVRLHPILRIVKLRHTNVL